MKLDIYKYMLLFFVLVILMAFTACNKTEDTNYTYAVLSSNGVHYNTAIDLYDSEGKILSSKEIKYKGVTYGAFMDKCKELNGHVYYANPISENHMTNFILQFDKNNLNVKEIKSKVSSPTVWDVDTEFAYLAGGNLNTFKLSKSSILDDSESDIVKEFNGNAILMESDNLNLYVLSIDNSDKTNVHANIMIIKKDDLSLISEIKIDDLMYSSDMKLINDKLYVLKSEDGKDKSTNNLVIVNLKNNEVQKIDLPFNNLNEIHMKDNYLFITQGNQRRDPTDKKIAKVNLNSLDFQEFTIEIDSFVSYIKDDNFIISDGVKIQIYNCNTFIKEKEILIKTNKQFSSFYIN